MISNRPQVWLQQGTSVIAAWGIKFEVHIRRAFIYYSRISTQQRKKNIPSPKNKNNKSGCHQSDIRFLLFSKMNLLVHPELFYTVLDVIDNLTSGCDTCIDVRLGCLRTHLLGR